MQRCGKSHRRHRVTKSQVESGNWKVTDCWVSRGQPAQTLPEYCERYKNCSLSKFMHEFRMAHGQEWGEWVENGFFVEGLTRSGFHFPSCFFHLSFGQASEHFSGSQYCGADNASLGVIVSMSRWPSPFFMRPPITPITHHPSPPPRKWFLLLVLQTELVVHTFHSNFHLAILSVWYIFSSPLPYRPPSRFFLFFFFAVLPPSQPTSSKSKLISSNQAHLSHVVRCQHFVAFPAMYTKNWLIKCKKSATCSV